MKVLRSHGRLVDRSRTEHTGKGGDPIDVNNTEIVVHHPDEVVLEEPVEALYKKLPEATDRGAKDRASCRGPRPPDRC